MQDRTMPVPDEEERAARAEHVTKPALLAVPRPMPFPANCGPKMDTLNRVQDGLRAERACCRFPCTDKLSCIRMSRGVRQSRDPRWNAHVLANETRGSLAGGNGTTPLRHARRFRNSLRGKIALQTLGPCALVNW
eukprot:10064828-Lingulodinium_polyedra.AAC.1